MPPSARAQVHSWAVPGDGNGTGPNSDKMATISSQRSQTEPTTAAEADRIDDKTHKHRRMHSRGLRSKGFTSGGSHVQHAKETVQSAIELMPPINFDHLLRRDKRSPAPSRRGSTGGQNSQQQHPIADPTTSWQDRQRVIAKERTVRPRDLVRVRAQNAQRQSELRKSLLGVEATAMRSTRDLDETYYAILEKASLLRSSVASLQQLADECQRLQTVFEDSSRELANSTTQNLDAFTDLDAQAQTIDGLVNKLQESKTRTTALNDRLDAARTRMEAFEQREGEHEKVLRKRWWTGWAVVTGILTLIVGFIIAKHRSAVGGTVYSVAKALDDLGGELKAPMIKLIRPMEREEDPYLKELFDDL